MSESLLLLEGVFHDAGTGLSVHPDDGPPRPLDEALDPFRGSTVHLSLHHYPPTPPQPAPGGGSCLWAGHCPCGHENDAAWLFNWSRKGDLSRLPSGIWLLSGDQIPFAHYMLGHRGRLVLFKEGSIDPNKGVEELLDEAHSLLGILEGLQGAIKK